MDSEFWLENWQNNRIGFHQAETNAYLLSYWEQLKLDRNSRVFVPLCGKSLDLIWLHQQGHPVLGVEVSELAVGQFFSENKIAHKQFKQDDFLCYQAESLAIFQGDFFNLTAKHLEGTQAVFDRAALVALPPELRRKYVRHLNCILPDKAKILIITFEYDQTRMNGPPFCVDKAEIESLYQDTFSIKLLMDQEVLNNYPQFMASGIKNLREKVYLFES